MMGGMRGHPPIKPAGSFNNGLNISNVGYSPSPGNSMMMMGVGALMPYGGDPYAGGHYMQSPALYHGGNVALRNAGVMNPRHYEMELSGIKSIDEIMIDHTSVLAIKRGDLAIIQGEVFKCTPIAPHLRDIPLVLKRLDCIDRRLYDLKVYELDTFMRFRGHPNIISLYSYWAEKASSPY